MKELIRKLMLGPELEEGLGGLKVVKIDYYRNENLITIKVAGQVEDSHRQMLEQVRSAMETRSKCTVKFLFGKPVVKPAEDAAEKPVEAAPAPVSKQAPTAPAGAAMVQVDPEIMRQLREEMRAKKEKAEAKKKEEPQVAKNSWVAKAKEFKEQASSNGETKNKFKPRKNSESIMGRVMSGMPKVDIKDLDDYSQNVNIEGNFVIMDDQKMADILKLSKSGTCVIAKFFIVDATGGTSALMFLKPEEADIFEKTFGKGGYAGFQVSTNYDRGEKGVRVSGIYEADPPPARRENCEYKRVELHVHSKMSEKDAISNPGDIMKLAASFGHRACAITDHGVVQGFPEAVDAVKGINKKKEEGEEKFKAILGCEGYLVDDGPTIFYNLPFIPRKDSGLPKPPMAVGEFVTLAIETNGDDPCTDTFTRVAASKYRLKGFQGIRPEIEGETDAQAQEFASHDIDTSLWEPDEIPESLRDENLPGTPSYGEEGVNHITNIDDRIGTPYSEDGSLVVPEEIVYEHVADFYADVEDIIYKGTGEPCDAYFRMGELVGFIGDAFVTGENIFDTLGFLRRAGYGINIEDHKYYRNKFNMPAISIEDIRKYACPENITESVESTHNDLIDKARKDAKFVIDYLTAEGSADPEALNLKIGHKSTDVLLSQESKAYHIIWLVRNNLGLYNLYHLVSESNVHYFYRRPRTPKSLLKYYKSSIIVGGACEQGEIYRYAMAKYKACGKDVNKALEALNEDETFKDILSLYDYVEIQPLCNNMFMTRNPDKAAGEPMPLNENDIRNTNILLADIADAFNLPLIATTDSHFLNKEDGMYRKNMLMDMGFADAEMQSDLYFRTTEEMLDEFSYLGEERALAAVVTNTNMIADKIEYGIKPFPDGTYPPMIPRAASDVRDIAYTRANKLYRHNGVLDPVVKERLDSELNSIIGNGFAIMYYIAYRLVKNSNNEGFIVGSRGSVGSSFTATMLGISEVNPLVPHYRCPKCNYVEFNNTGEYGSGYDLPEKNCPECGANMHRDGQDIPFATFLGFYGDKQPDIDLNFSSLNQASAHKYVDYLFGTTHTFKAGTVGTVASKNALMIARNVCDKKQIPYTTGDLLYMSRGLLGVKRTTSQHPGGIVVVPKEMDVYEFTPIQYPANKTDCGIITTHFDFHSLHDTILKLDILGHLDPTVLRMLHLLTGVEITDIPVPEPKVMSLLESTDALGFPIEESEAGSATIGLSELGTPMARGMIKETKPTRFYDLVQLMGLSHGTDVWKGNAQDLISEGTCDLNSVIGCRDSIMTTLIYWGLPNKDAFDIMEAVRKGKVASGAVADKWEKWKAMMKECNVPDWYIGSCEKIKYMFPKAHAAAYSISTLRVAWFKVYYPEEYYCAYFTIRGEEFDAQYMCKDMEVLKARMEVLKTLMHSKESSAKKAQDEYFLCELVAEMHHRGIEFAPIDLKTSHATDFTKVDKGLILPPLDCIDSISASMARGITAARDEAPFKNREDLMQRGKIGQAAIETLDKYGLIDDLPESAQIDLFSFMDGQM
ncbi:MAG: PolC-type DNA polymerase III [Clostridiales bacterium]|nr:PolC-type DNA polymerase III [Clostridiales bacterium]MBP3811068.1 PolC-type DNA polymerase III [Clostridiales bacterium]